MCSRLCHPSKTIAYWSEDRYLHSVERLLEQDGDETALNNFRKRVDSSFKEQLAELGFEPRQGESQNDTQSRVAVIDAMASLAHDDDAVAKSVEYADRESADPASVDANLAPYFVDIAAQFGDRARMDKYVKVYQKRKDEGASPQETNRYLHSLATFANPKR